MDFKNFILSITDINKKHILEFLKDWEGFNLGIPKSLKYTKIFSKYNKNLVDKLIKNYGGRTIYIQLNILGKKNDK